jgi:signal transduction histidine kinase
MKSLRWRLTLWFGLSLLVVVSLLVVSAHWHLEYELRKEKWERTDPAHPDWVLHGSFTDQEVHEILGELLQFWLAIGGPIVALSLLAAHFLGRQSVRPIREVNQQLSNIGPTSLSQRVKVPESDPEFTDLVLHLNQLLGRLENSFDQLTEYTGQVAHELRTPLQLMRLQLDRYAAGMEPALAEELQQELARLSNYVESTLTVARAEQGRLEVEPQVIALKQFLTDTIEPFSRLAADQRRRLLWSCPDGAVAWADKSALKQILFNLLSNALKHGEGDILVRARLHQRTFSVLVGNRSADPTRNAKQGLGIGLRLVRALARHSAEIKVTFRKGHNFWVRLRIPSGRKRASGDKKQFQYA